MTDNQTRQCLRFADVERFLAKSYNCMTGGRKFDIEKYEPYIDTVRHLLVPSLEKQILFCLERFVYNENFQDSLYQPYLSRYKESMLTAFSKYSEIGTSVEAMRDLITMDHVVNFLENVLITNNRLNKLVDDLDALEVDKNILGYVNVLNYINEKDFWICSSSSFGDTSLKFNNAYSLSKENIISDMKTMEKVSRVEDETRSRKRPKKRAATHICRKHYKLEQLAKISDKSFRVSESLYDLLMRNWELNDSMQTKPRMKKNLNFFSYRKKHPKTEWKDVKLTFLLKKKIQGTETETSKRKVERNFSIKTSLSLPCKVDQLLVKLERADDSLTKFHCNFIKKKFNTKLCDVCYCLNNLLSKIDGKMINLIYLICEIRKDYLNFKLKRVPSLNNNLPLFSARITTCEALYKYGIMKNSSRNKFKSQRYCAAKKANDELSIKEHGHEISHEVNKNRNVDVPNDEVISSIEISFIDCEGSPKDQRDTRDELTYDFEDLEGLVMGNSSSINDVIQKLELSPFHLQETEQSFRMRSKIRDIVRSIIICTRGPSLEGKHNRRSISVQAIVSASSVEKKTKRKTKVSKIESKSSEVLRRSLSKIVSFIETKIFPSKSRECTDCKKSIEYKNTAGVDKFMRPNESTSSKKSRVAASCLGAKDPQIFKSRDSVRSHKSLKPSKSPSSKKPAELKNNNNSEICTTFERPVKSKEFRTGYRLPQEITRTINSEISNTLAKVQSAADSSNDYEINVTVEFEDSFESSNSDTGSISRHTHVLPSMKSVKLGTNKKYLPCHSSESTSSSPLPFSSSSSTSSSKNKIFLTRDNLTTMNKSMMSSSYRGTISAKSYERMKNLIRKKVSEKFSDADSCQPNSSKTIISNGKYYLYIPSSKTSRGVPLRHEISESSSSDSHDNRICSNRDRISETLSKSSEIISNKSSSCRCIDSESLTESSRVVNFDKNSSYGCVEDRLANKCLTEIINDYSDEAGDSPRSKNVKPQLCSDRFSETDDYEIRYGARKSWQSKCSDFEIGSDENGSSFSQIFSPTGEEFTTYVEEKSVGQQTCGLDDCESFRKFEKTGWSTCAIRSSSSSDCPKIYLTKSNCRRNVRGRCNFSQQKKIRPFSIIEKYKKRFQSIDRSLRAKLLRYVDLYKNAKSNFQKQICLDDIYEASRTSIPSSDFRRCKCNEVYLDR